jgi:hypothetical protein
LLSTTDQPDPRVAHPDIPCWTGERTWSAPGEPPSDVTVFEAGRDPPGVTIEHKRDHIRRGANLEQDYNFLDYRFAALPQLRARVYLDEPGRVQVSFEDGRRVRSLAALRRHAGHGAVCYLQKRFRVIEAFHGEAGPRAIWQLP